ncbi:MAG: type IV secretory system conjugative DNA transfer family protein [Acidimicrobiales bacterium]
MSKKPLVWYELRWPREVEPEQVMQVFRRLVTSAGTPVIIEAVGSTTGVSHRLAMPLGRSGVAVHQLRAALPGLAIDKLDQRPQTIVSRAIELHLSTRTRPLRTDDAVGASGATLTALAHVGPGERLVLQWVLGRKLSPQAVPNQLPGTAQRSAFGVLFGGQPRREDVEGRNALRAKQAEPGWRISGRIGAHAESRSRQRQLIRQVLGALQGAEAPGIGFWVRSTDPGRLAQATVPWWRPLRLNVNELAILSAWPVGPTSELPVAKIGSRLVRPASALPRHGRVVADATFPGAERPLALRPLDALRHTEILGPTGSGKSTVLLNLIVQDIEAGRGVVVIEPKGDLIAETLKRIPEERIGDVVLIDPTDEQSSRPVGVNPLAPAGRSPELVADQLLGVFHALFAAHWGPRTSDILGSALLTLARTPGMTLAALPLLLSDGGFRRRVLAKIDDPIGLEPFWAAFESWSEQERATAIAPAMRRLRPFLVRPDLRVITSQAKPRFDMRQVFSQRKILLVNLSKGLLGPETAALLGSLVITQLWQASLGRSAIAPERRHPVFVYVDEFQDYLRLPTDFADALAQARGLGVGFVLAHQYMHQLDPAMRSAVLANVQSRVAFRLPHDDARLIAAGGALEPDDFQSLGAYQCYAQLVADGAVQPWCSGQARLPAEPISDPETVRSASRERYGIDRSDVEAEIRQLVFGRRETNPDDIGPRRRRDGGAS